MPTSEPRVIVVGGGVIGVCCAYFLAKRGARVTLLERDEIAKAASFGNAGTIAPGHSPINKPGRVRQVLKSLRDPLSPLYIAPRADPALAAWLWSFARTCTQRHLESSLEVLGRLGHASRRLFDELVAGENLDCGYRPEGYYEAYLTRAALEAAIEEADLVRRHGYHPASLSGDELREREPALNKQVLGGIFHPGAATLHPYRFVTELADRSRRQGASIETRKEAVKILTANGKTAGVRTAAGEILEADAIILATGAYGAGLLRALGFRLPLQAAKGYHRDYPLANAAAPRLRQACVLGEASVFCTPMRGFVRYAGTLEFSGLNHELRRPRLEQLTRAAGRYLVAREEGQPQSEWCGLRPCLPDGLPAVGPVARYQGLYVATGHAMLGLTLGPVTGKLMAEWVLDGRASEDITALRPGRF